MNKQMSRSQFLKGNCNSRTYQGKRKPRCCGGQGCRTCWLIYEQTQCDHPLRARGYRTKLDPKNVGTGFGLTQVYGCDKCAMLMQEPSIADLVREINTLSQRVQVLELRR